MAAGQSVEMHTLTAPTDPKKLPLEYLIKCGRELYDRKHEIEARHQKEWAEYNEALNLALDITRPPPQPR
jgi:hypothetical protein